MEQIYYDELLNNEVISSANKIQNIKTRLVAFMVFIMSTLGSQLDEVYKWFIIIVFMYIPIGVYLIHKRSKETKQITKLVSFYNDCIENNNFLEVDEDLKCGFVNISKDIILDKLELIWKPEFVYDDETRVYKAENAQIIIVNGYFKDNSISRKPKRKYTILLNDCKYYMSCIDNLICWEKDTPWAKYYTKDALKKSKMDFTKW